METSSLYTTDFADNETTSGTPDQYLSVNYKQLLFLSKKQKEDAVEILRFIRWVFVAIAIPATLCNLVIFTRKGMRSATGAYVIGISCAQLFYVIFLSCSYVLGQFVTDPTSSVAYCARVYFSLYVVVFGSLVAQRAFYVLMCLMSLERLYAVVRPLHIKTFFLAKHSSVSTFAAFLLSAIWHVYILTKYSILHETNVFSDSGIVCKFQRSALYEKQKEINDTFGLSAKIVMSYITLSVQIVLNVLTTVALRQHNVTLRHMHSSTNDEAKTQRERQMTMTILVTSLSYVILFLPLEINNFLATVIPGYSNIGKYANLYTVVADVAFNLATLSCGVDCLCFYRLSSRYRHILHRLLGLNKAVEAGDRLGANLNNSAETIDTVASTVDS